MARSKSISYLLPKFFHIDENRKAFYFIPNLDAIHAKKFKAFCTHFLFPKFSHANFLPQKMMSHPYRTKLLLPQQEINKILV